MLFLERKKKMSAESPVNGHFFFFFSNLKKKE